MTVRTSVGGSNEKARSVPGFAVLGCLLYELDFQAFAHALGDAL